MCFSVGGAGANVGFANAIAGPAFVATVCFTKGMAQAGLGLEAVGDTAVSDSFVVTYANTGASQTTLTIKGKMLVEDSAPPSTFALLRVLVYPDQSAADGDPTHAGVGALFNGKLDVTSSSHTASGGFVNGDFPATVGAGRYAVAANNLSKVVNGVPDTASVVVKAFADSRSLLPMTSPLIALLVAMTLGGSAAWAIRRRKVITAA